MEITAVRVISSANYKPVHSWETKLEDLPTFDNTKLVAINTCPLWGIVRYTHHKTFSGVGRAMALEAGGAAHEVFAAHRLFSFGEHAEKFYGVDTGTVERSFRSHGERIFGKSRFEEMVNAVDPDEDERTRCQQFSLTALYNSGFYDDPGDKRRTTTNIEEMCLAYMDKYDWKSRLPYWNKDTDFLGIEVPVDVVIYIDYKDDRGEDSIIVIRFIGKADGLHWVDRDQEVLRVHENKTASRLGDAWEMSWETNHQPTGYMIALSAMLDLSISQSEMLGTCLPLPKSVSIGGLARVVVKRAQWQLLEWFQWLLHTALLHEQYKDNATNAPMYTHSCNRYFRPCSFITLCATAPEERKALFDEMEQHEWNPLHTQGEPSDD